MAESVSFIKLIVHEVYVIKKMLTLKCCYKTTWSYIPGAVVQKAIGSIQNYWKFCGQNDKDVTAPGY